MNCRSSCLLIACELDGNKKTSDNLKPTLIVWTLIKHNSCLDNLTLVMPRELKDFNSRTKL